MDNMTNSISRVWAYVALAFTLLVIGLFLYVLLMIDWLVGLIGLPVAGGLCLAGTIYCFNKSKK